MDLMGIMTEDSKCQDFADYFLLHYLEGRFSPQLWASGEPSIRRTNNSVESWHSKINGELYTVPNIYIFCDIIIGEEEMSRSKMRSSQTTANTIHPKERSKLEMLRNWTRSFTSDLGARPITIVGPPAGECLSRPAYLRRRTWPALDSILHFRTPA